MKLSKIAKKMIFTVSILLLVIFAASFAYFRSLSFFPFALGALSGVSLNVFKIIMLDRVVDKAIQMEEKKAGNYIMIQYLLRFVLTGLVLVASHFIPFIELWGTAVGVLTMPIAAFFAGRGE